MFVLFRIAWNGICQCNYVQKQCISHVHIIKKHRLFVFKNHYVYVPICIWYSRYFLMQIIFVWAQTCLIETYVHIICKMCECLNAPTVKRSLVKRILFLVSEIKHHHIILFKINVVLQLMDYLFYSLWNILDKSPTQPTV